MESVEEDVMIIYMQSTTLWNGHGALRNQRSHVFDHAKWNGKWDWEWGCSSRWSLNVFLQQVKENDWHWKKEREELEWLSWQKKKKEELIVNDSDSNQNKRKILNL